MYIKLSTDYIEVKKEVQKEDESKDTWNGSKLIKLFYIFCYLYIFFIEEIGKHRRF